MAIKLVELEPKKYRPDSISSGAAYILEQAGWGSTDAEVREFEEAKADGEARIIMKLNEWTSDRSAAYVRIIGCVGGPYGHYNGGLLGFTGASEVDIPRMDTRAIPAKEAREIIRQLRESPEGDRLRL